MDLVSEVHTSISLLSRVMGLECIPACNEADRTGFRFITEWRDRQTLCFILMDELVTTENSWETSRKWSWNTSCCDSPCYVSCTTHRVLMLAVHSAGLNSWSLYQEKIIKRANSKNSDGHVRESLVLVCIGRSFIKRRFKSLEHKLICL